MTKKQPAEQKIAMNMKQAEVVFGVSKAVQKLAKENGCTAFKAQRVHRDPLLQWVKDNPQLVAKAEAAANDTRDHAELKRQKLAAEVTLLDAKVDSIARTTISRDEAKSEWARALAIIQEEAKSLMEPDPYRIFCERIKAKIGEVLPK